MKKRIYLINMVLTALILIISASILVTAALSRFKNEIPEILGYSFHIVITDSMAPEIMEKDFVLAKKADISEAEVGDYIVFESPDPSLAGKVIIHSVVETGTDENGKYLITSGIKEGASPDRYPVREISGKYVYNSAFLGRIFWFMTDFKNLVFLAITAAALFVAVKYMIKIAAQVKNSKKSDEDAERGS